MVNVVLLSTTCPFMAQDWVSSRAGLEGKLRGGGGGGGRSVCFLISTGCYGRKGQESNLRSFIKHLIYKKEIMSLSSADIFIYGKRAGQQLQEGTGYERALFQICKVISWWS